MIELGSESVPIDRGDATTQTTLDDEHEREDGAFGSAAAFEFFHKRLWVHGFVLVLGRPRAAGAAVMPEFYTAPIIRSASVSDVSGSSESTTDGQRQCDAQIVAITRPRRRWREA